MYQSINKIYAATDRFLNSNGPEEMYSILVDEAIKISKAQIGSLLLTKQGEIKKMGCRTAAAPDEKLNDLLKTYQAEHGLKPVILNSAYIRKQFPELYGKGTRSLIMLPLDNHNELLGYLILQFKKKTRFSKNELKSFKMFAVMASIAIKKSHLYSEIQHARELKDIFIALASHELRTPLTTMTGYIQLLHKRLCREDGIEKKWISELAKESQRFTSLVNDLLEANRIRAGKIQYRFSSVSLLTVVNTAISGVLSAHPDARVRFDNKTMGASVVLADGLKLSQAIGNILDNAIKFSPRNAEVRIMLDGNGSSYGITVQDSGCGIPREDLPHIFDGLYKPRDNHRSGLGIGLMMSRYIIDKHGGSLTVGNTSPRGTSMRILLPYG